MGKGDFSRAAARGRILNYVWINKDPFDPNSSQVACGTPLHYIDRAIGNARRYPDTNVKVWLDNTLLDERSLALTRRHIEEAGLGNIELHDLNEVPAFRKERGGLFDPRRDVVAIRGLRPEQVTFEHDNIWGRVDLARLLVVDYCLKTTRARDVIYSDFDVKDAKLNDRKAQQQLDKYGMVFGGVQPGLKDGDPRIEIENSYMGFRRDKMDKVLLDDIIHGTRKAVANGFNGYGPYYEKLREWYAQKDIRMPSAQRRISAHNMEEIFFPASPPMRTKIPMPTAYKG